MSKPKKKRASASGQYVSPLLNELEWLDEEPEEKPAAKKKRPARKAAKKSAAKPTKSGPTAKINFDARAVPSQPSWRRGPAAPQPLLMLDKRKQSRTAKAWVKQLFDDLEGRMASPSDEAIAEAIHSFRRGLDGILRGGEEPKPYASPRRRPVVIEVAEEMARVREAQRPDGQPEPQQPQPAAAAAAEAEETDEGAERGAFAEGAGLSNRELQQFGLIPYRFNVFDAWQELSISFATPFAGGQYVLVATTNQPGCHVVIREKAAAYAVVRLVRDGTSPHLEGELNWIALGEATTPPPYRQ